MRWQWIPLLAALACVLAMPIALMPVVAVTPSLARDVDVHWMKAASDLRPRRPMEGERQDDLRTPEAIAGAQARQYTLVFERRNSTAPLAAMLPVASSSTRIFANGVAAPTERLGATLLATLPNAALQAGANRLDIVVPEAAPYQWMRAVYLGPHAELGVAQERLAFVRTLGTRLTALFAAACAALGFLSAFAFEARRGLFAPALASMLFAVIAALIWFESAPGVQAAQPWAEAVLTAAAALALMLTAGGRWEDWPRRYSLAFRVCATGLGVCALAWLLSFWLREATLHLAHWGRLAAIVTGGGAAFAAAVVPQTATAAPGRHAAVSLLALSLVAGGVASIGALGGAAFVYGQALADLAACVGILALFAAVGTQAFADVERLLQTRLSLGRVVREQQEQLRRQQQALEQEIGKRAMLEERERLSRDIHDGVGGSLVSLLMQARTGQLREDELQVSLERALEDLRLMIDALDHAGASLPTAFSTFQTRIAPAFAAAGIALDWRQNNLEGRAFARPGTLMQVFRILQEACTNVIRHSKAAAAMVKIGWSGETNSFELDVEDDGRAVAGDRPSGNGLKNMASRAAKIGGALTAGPRENHAGWLVRLRVSDA